MPEETLPNVPHSERAENQFCRATDGTKMKDRGGKKITFKTRNEGTLSMNFRVAVSKNFHKKNTVVIDEEGSYIENPASGRRATMRVENRVCVIEMYLKDLVGHAQDAGRSGTHMRHASL